jgi:hypothetical protein
MALKQTDTDELHRREWVLEPETEYRFELDPKTFLGITVRFSFAAVRVGTITCVTSSWKDRQRYSEQS